MGLNRFQNIFFLVCFFILSFLLFLNQKQQKPVVLEPETEELRPCQGEERRLCVPPLLVFEKRFRTASKYRINICAIEKNLSTILTAIACFLFNQTNYVEKAANFNDEDFHHRTCRTKNEALEMEALTSKFGIELADWIHIAPIREPVERFISGFVDKCLVEKVWEKHPSLCNGCQTNVTCFAEQEYLRMMKYANGAPINSFDDRHFFPQNWRCQFYEHFRRFVFLPYSSTDFEAFLQQLYPILKSQNVSDEDLSFIDDQIHSGQTKHTTTGRQERLQVERQVYTNPRLLALLTRMYYYDFVLFGFPFPKLII